MFKRLDEKIAAAAMGSDSRAALRRFARRLRSVSEEMRAHAATLEAFEVTPGEEWEALADKRRRDLTAEFFEYLQTLAAAAGDNMARREGMLAGSEVRILWLCKREWVKRVVANGAISPQNPLKRLQTLALAASGHSARR